MNPARPPAASRTARVAEWLLPAARFPRDDVPKLASSMLLLGFGLACALACGFFAISDAVHGMRALGAIYAVAAAGCVACVLGFRRSARLLLWGNLFIGLLFAISALANLGAGGRLQGVNMVLPTLVMVAALMLDRRSAIAWSLLILAQMLVAYWLAQRSPATLFAVVEGWDSTAYQRVPLVMVVLSIFLAVWFKQMIERIQQHLLELHRSEREARSESERLNRMLAEMAAVDPLTGLLNRRAFLEALAHCEAAAEHWLLYVDLDGFKAVNDQLGHEAGDRVLIDVAAVLRNSGVDVAARLGGDEFCLLLHGNEFRARQIAERIVQSVAAMVTGGPASPRIGASIGVARTNGNNIEAALRNADAACYRAKRGGKSQFALAVERSG